MYNGVWDERVWDENSFVEGGYRKDLWGGWSVEGEGKYNDGWKEYKDEGKEYRDGYYGENEGEEEYYIWGRVV